MQPALPEQLEPLEQPDLLDHLALRAQRVKPVQLVHKDLPEPKDLLAQLALKALLALLA